MENTEISYYCGYSDTIFPIGPCASIKECVSEFFSDYQDEIEEEKDISDDEKEYTTIYIGKMDKMPIRVCGVQFWENFLERLYDDAYEDFWDRATSIDKAKQKDLGRRITEVVSKWIDENNLAELFNVIYGVKELSLDEGRDLLAKASTLTTLVYQREISETETRPKVNYGARYE